MPGRLKSKSQFRSKLVISPSHCDDVWILNSPLIYYSRLLKREIIVPTDFQTDLASVPRVPIIFSLWGGKAHREGVLHDYLFRYDSEPVVSFMKANNIFLEAMVARKKPFYVRHPMYMGVVLGGHPSYHNKIVEHNF